MKFYDTATMFGWGSYQKQGYSLTFCSKDTLVTNNIKDSIKESAYLIVAKSVFWNFFSWSMLLIVLGVTLFGLGFGKLKLGTAKNESEELTKGHVEKEQKASQTVQEYPGKARNR